MLPSNRATRMAHPPMPRPKNKLAKNNQAVKGKFTMPDEIEFYIEKVRNHFMGSRNEWTLKAKSNDMEPWVLFVWKETKPTINEILDITLAVKRGIEFYHQYTQPKPPKFKIKGLKK